MTTREVLIEMLDFCSKKLRQIDGEVILLKAIPEGIDYAFEKEKKISKIEGELRTYLDVINKLKEIKNAIQD